MEEVSHLVPGMLGFGCALVPLWGRVPGPGAGWVPHAVMAAVMGAMVVLGMSGPVVAVLAGALLATAAVLWWELPRSRERLYVVADLVAMLLLVVLTPRAEEPVVLAAHSGAHGGGGPGWPLAPLAVFGFWVLLHLVCAARSLRPVVPMGGAPHRHHRGDPTPVESLSSLGMVGSMVVMALPPG